MRKYFSFFMMALSLVLLYSCSNDEPNNDVDLAQTAILYATNTQNGNVLRYNINTGRSLNMKNPSTSTEAISYDGTSDSFTIISGSTLQLQTFTAASKLHGNRRRKEDTISINPSFSSTANLENPGDIAASENFFVVSGKAENNFLDSTSNGRLYIYAKTQGALILRNIVRLDFQPWGITFVGNTLYAVHDMDNSVSSFKNFLSANLGNTQAFPTKTVHIEGVNSLKGIDENGGTLVLSDVGNMASEIDGAYQVITDFETKFNAAPASGFLPLSSQMRVEGGNTEMGNPVNIVYNTGYDAIFVAEASKGGGRILAFNNVTSSSGNITPAISRKFSQASSVFFYTN